MPYKWLPLTGNPSGANRLGTDEAETSQTTRTMVQQVACQTTGVAEVVQDEDLSEAATRTCLRKIVKSRLPVALFMRTTRFPFFDSDSRSEHHFLEGRRRTYR